MVCFISSAGVLHESNSAKKAHEIPWREQLLLIFTLHILITFVNSSQIILSDPFFSVFPLQRFGSMQRLLNGSLMLNKETNTNLVLFSTSTDNTLLHFSVLPGDVMGFISQSVSSNLLLDSSSSSRTGAGRSLLRSLLLLPQAEPGAVFTLLITGEGLADRRAITDSPQARGWERYKHPSLSPKCDGNVQLSRGSLHWQNPRAQREILKT